MSPPPTPNFIFLVASSPPEQSKPPNLLTHTQSTQHTAHTHTHTHTHTHSLSTCKIASNSSITINTSYHSVHWNQHCPTSLLAPHIMQRRARLLTLTCNCSSDSLHTTPASRLHTKAGAEQTHTHTRCQTVTGCHSNRTNNTRAYCMIAYLYVAKSSKSSSTRLTVTSPHQNKTNPCVHSTHVVGGANA